MPVLCCLLALLILACLIIGLLYALGVLGDKDSHPRGFISDKEAR